MSDPAATSGADGTGFQTTLGYRFDDPSLLERSLAHRSWVAENEVDNSNERLEFLGDAILGWVVADLVFRRYADESEGALTDLRKSVVNSQALADVARSLGVGDQLLLGRGERNAGGADKDSILADAMEAIIGAVYLDGGTQPAFDLIERLFVPLIEAALGGLDRLDEKSALQELAAQIGYPAPMYTVAASGPDHAKRFVATVLVGDITTTGEGRSKKAAQQAAASEAVTRLSAETAGPDTDEPSS